MATSMIEADTNANANLLLPLSTPGDILRTEFLEPLQMTPYRLAKEMGVPQTRIEPILDGKRAITHDTDERLCRFFGLSPGFWLRIQRKYDDDVWSRTRKPETYEAIRHRTTEG